MISNIQNSEQTLCLMQNMFEILAQSNQPLQIEIQKTSTAFRTFMEEMRKNVETLMQENLHLKQQLIDSESKNRESERILQMDIKSLMENNKLLIENNKTLQQELNILKQTVNSTLNTRVAQLEKQIPEMKNEIQYHGHKIIKKDFNDKKRTKTTFFTNSTFVSGQNFITPKSTWSKQ